MFKGLLCRWTAEQTVAWLKFLILVFGLCSTGVKNTKTVRPDIWGRQRSRFGGCGIVSVLGRVPAPPSRLCKDAPDPTSQGGAGNRNKIQKHTRAELTTKTTKVNKKALLPPVPPKIDEFYSIACPFGGGPPLHSIPPAYSPAGGSQLEGESGRELLLKPRRRSFWGARAFRTGSLGFYAE